MKKKLLLIFFLIILNPFIMARGEIDFKKFKGHCKGEKLSKINSLKKKKTPLNVYLRYVVEESCFVNNLFEKIKSNKYETCLQKYPYNKIGCLQNTFRKIPMTVNGIRLYLKLSSDVIMNTKFDKKGKYFSSTKTSASEKMMDYIVNSISSLKYFNKHLTPSKIIKSITPAPFNSMPKDLKKELDKENPNVKKIIGKLKIQNTPQFELAIIEYRDKILSYRNYIGLLRFINRAIKSYKELLQSGKLKDAKLTKAKLDLLKTIEKQLENL